MNRVESVRWVVILAVTILLTAHSVSAQPRLTVSGAVFADVKRFSGDTTSLPLDGTAFGGGVRIRSALAQQWTVELGLDAGRTTTTTHNLTSLPTAAPRQDRTRNQLTATEAIVGFHPRASGRARLGYLGGVTFLHVVRKTDRLRGTVEEAGSLHTMVDNVAAVSVGVEADLSLSRHLSVVPEVRALAFSLSGTGPSGFAIRPGLAMRWHF